MPDPTARTLNLGEARLLHRPIVFERLLLLVQEPLFSAAEATKLAAGEVARSEGDGKLWCTLGKWVVTDPAEEGGVFCRESILEIFLPRSPAAGEAQVLPFEQNSPAAELVYGTGTSEQRRPLQVAVNTAHARLELKLPFTLPGDSRERRAAGHQLYSEVLDALSSPGGVELRLSYSHPYRVKEGQPPPPSPPPPGRFDPALIMVPAARRGPGAVMMRPAAGGPIAARAPVPVAAAAERARPAGTPAVRLAAADAVMIHRLRHTAVAPAEGTSTGERRAIASGQRSNRVERPRNHATAYPDLRRAAQQGWDHIQGTTGKIHFRGTPKADTFHYLPTHYQLGHYLSPDGTAALAPMGASLYRAGETDYRVKTRLVAVPGIDDADRDALRSHVRDFVLLGTQPFVRLEPVGGLAADFQSSFTAGPGGEHLPASISLKAEVDVDDHLLLEFDMPALQYAIFSELLRKGLHGNVRVEAPGALQETIPVALSLVDIVAVPRPLSGAPAEGLAEGVFFWQSEPPDAAEGEPAEETEARRELTLANRLPYPVRLSSLRLSLLEAFPDLAQIFDAEEIDVLPEAVVLATRGDEAGKDRTTLAFSPRRLAVWNETVVLPGPLLVQGGSAQEWLDRVHRDPTLTPAELSLALELVPVQGAEQIQILRLRLFRAGEARLRQEWELTPTQATVTRAARLTLDELAGREGRAPSFDLEYDCVYRNGGVSLAQRLAVDPDQAHVVLRPVVETPNSVYLVTYSGAAGEERAELPRGEAARLVEELRVRGASWRIYPQERPAPEPEVPAPSAPEPGTPEPDDTPEPAASSVTVVASLLADPFTRGELDSVFVTLQGEAAGAAQTTLRFDASHRGDQVWSPAGGGIPPFRYRITYVFAGDQPPKHVEGTEAGPLLVLDPAG